MLPPVAMITATAFSIALRVTMSRGFRSASTAATKARAEELHRLKLKQLADEENAKARQQREGTTTVRPSGGGGGSGGAGTSGPVNVTVNVPNAMLVDDRTADAVARRRLGREVATLQRVRHPHVAEVLDSDLFGPVPFGPDGGVGPYRGRG